jgi:predicted nucleotidyltransferase
LGTGDRHAAGASSRAAPARGSPRSVVGSIARAEGKRTSDIDILIELAPQAPIGLFEYVGITQYIAGLFPVRVDVANRSSLKPLVRPNIERDAIYAF